MANDYRVVQGQQLVLRTIASSAISVRAKVGILYDTGNVGTISLSTIVTGSSRVEEDFAATGTVTGPGRIIWSVVELGSSTVVKRGQCYTRLFMGQPGSIDGPVLSEDYVYTSHAPSLGIYRDSGPGGGPGYLLVVTLKSSSAPAASTSLSLGTGNSIRKFLGIAWYFNASADAASRVLQVTYLNPLGSYPTGFGTDANAVVWASPALTLTASQEGTIYASEKVSVKNTNGTVAQESSASAPSPFPFVATEGDTGDLVFTVTDGHANDRDTIYYYIEEWLVI